MPPAVEIVDLSHSYGDRLAIDRLTLSIQAGEIFAVLGPNGGGKTTLFRVLSTLIPAQRGEVRMLGFDLRRETDAIRRRLGVVFQAPSLDRKLTVLENIRHQAALYGLHGEPLQRRIDELLETFNLKDRAGELTERLSGGLRRRVELAKGLIHHPRLLLLDEPSTGLDPGARADLWNYLTFLRSSAGVTIVLTTHYLDEADRADRIAILHQGKLVAEDTPTALRNSVGGDSLLIEADDAPRLAEEIAQRFSLPAKIVDEVVRIEVPDGHQWVSRLVEAYPGRITAVRLGKPTLEDVFIARTGHRFWQETGRG
jgi:ABC-2 type transport system ATP-binding protein